MMTPAYTTGAALIGSWVAEMERGEAPARFLLAEPFASLDLRPGRLILFGGGAGERQDGRPHTSGR